MKIIFMGTPDFAVPFFSAILSDKNHEIAAVFTQVPKKSGRGLAINNSPIYNAAQQENIPIYTPISLKNEATIELIQSIDADIIVVVAYGFILPQQILCAKHYGCVNVHPSLLPKYRGAAPMQHTILNGDTESGVCIIKMDTGMDTGDIIASEKFSIAHDIQYPELTKICTKIGSKLLLHVLNNIEALKPMPQSERASFAPKISSEHSKIDWRNSASKIDCQIRALTPRPGVYFEYCGEKIKILSSNVVRTNIYSNETNSILVPPTTIAPGTIIDDQLSVMCGDGNVLKIMDLQKPGKKSMSSDAFLRGNHIPVNTIL